MAGEDGVLGQVPARGVGEGGVDWEGVRDEEVGNGKWLRTSWVGLCIWSGVRVGERFQFGSGFSGSVMIIDITCARGIQLEEV